MRFTMRIFVFKQKIPPKFDRQTIGLAAPLLYHSARGEIKQKNISKRIIVAALFCMPNQEIFRSSLKISGDRPILSIRCLSR
jgi:hypothetical protein